MPAQLPFQQLHCLCVSALCLLQQCVAQVPVACTTEQAGIPGLYLIHDFVSEQEQQELLVHIDSQPWQHLAKRRVQHYGFKFEYSQRGVDLNQQVGHMPDWTQEVVQRLQVGSLWTWGLTRSVRQCSWHCGTGGMAAIATCKYHCCWGC
jgi:hypothetical protein